MKWIAAALVLSVATGVAERWLAARRYVVNILNPNGSRTTVDVRQLGSVNVEDLRTGTRAPLFPNRAFTLWVFLSGGECATCLDEFATWQFLASRRDSPRVDVKAIMIRTSPSEAASIAKDYTPPFPLLFDFTETLGKSSHLPKTTPFQVLTDPSGRVLLVEGPHATPSERDTFQAAVLAAVRR